jgi:hypothetical protein
MTDYSKRVFEAIVRVLVFRTAHPELFPKDSQADQLLQKVEAISRIISSQSTSQASGKNDVRISADVRTNARENLRKDLESITRTAASMGLKQFFMPRDRSDRSYTDVGRIFAMNAEPLKQDFIANHMPEDFIERLKAGIENIERSIEQQAASKGARKVATTALTNARTEAIAVLARLDPVMDNLLRDNTPIKAAWDAARHVEKAASGKKPVESPPATPADKAA